MAIRPTSKSMEEAKQRLRQSLETLESVAQTQFAALERNVLEAKAASIMSENEMQELRQSYAREKSAREHADALLNSMSPRLDKMSDEIIAILNNAEKS